MERQKQCLMQNQKGFTLIEIITVLVLLGILASIAIPRYFDMRDDAKERIANAAVGAAVANLELGQAQFLLHRRDTSDMLMPQEVCEAVDLDDKERITITCEVTPLEANWEDVIRVHVSAVYDSTPGTMTMLWHNHPNETSTTQVMTP